MTDGLKDKYRQAIIDILAAHPGVEKAVLFGSRAIGTFTSTSDVDIALFGDSLSLADQVKLARKIDQLPMPQCVDLLRYKTINEKKLLAHIRKRGVEWFNCTKTPKTPSGKAGKRKEMVSEWHSKTLGNICSSVAYGYTASACQERVGPHFIRITDIVHDNIDWKSVPYCEISEDLYDKYRLESGDIVIARTGATSGYGKLIRENMKAVFASYLVRFRVAQDVADPVYVGKIVESQAYKDYIKSNITGSAQPQANAKVLGSYTLPLPPLRIQHRIAHILSTLDDKIELNRRMNRTLEKMAAAIFKSWFIDFDPVHAKAAPGNSRDPGLPPEIANLFPNSFQDSPLGPIPKGWEVSRLPEVISVNPKRVLPKGANAPYVEMKAMPMKLSRPDSWPNRVFKSGSKFISGDVLLARITPCLENGKTAYVDFLADGQVAWGSTEYIVFYAQPPVSPEFVYFLARSDRLREHAIANMTGTSGRQRVPPSCFDLKTVHPARRFVSTTAIYSTIIMMA